jgi:hypothetical protein
MRRVAGQVLGAIGGRGAGIGRGRFALLLPPAANYIKETTTAGGRQRFRAGFFLRGVVPPKTFDLGTFDTRADAEAGAYSRTRFSSTSAMFNQ